MNESTHSLPREFAGLIFVATALFVFFALFSYYPKDPSFNLQIAEPTEVVNWGGPIGAYTADALAQLFGSGAFFFPIWLSLIGWSLLRGYSFARWNSIVSFGALLVITFCTLLNIRLEIDPFFDSSAFAGGFLGETNGPFLLKWLNTLGSQLVLFVLLFISVLALAGISVNNVIDAFIFLARKALQALTQSLIWCYKKIHDFVSRFFTDYQDGVELFEKTKKRKPKKSKQHEPIIISGLDEIRRPAPKKTAEKENNEDFSVQENLPFDKDVSAYQVPPLDLLKDPEVIPGIEQVREQILINTSTLERKLLDFGIEGKILQVLPGPVITLYEFEPAPGIKVSRILALTEDLALAMRVPSVRILAPVPGKPVVGIELPNPKREIVTLKEIVYSDDFSSEGARLPLALGKDHIGHPVVQDLSQVPHLLMAGSTGSGKSVGINSAICSILLKSSPDEVKLIMIDPKMLELSMYDGIPHLISPVVTNPKKAAAAMQWAVNEMDTRYQLMSDHKVRNIAGFNLKIDRLSKERELENLKKKEEEKSKGKSADTQAQETEETEGEKIVNDDNAIPKKLPYIVIVIDELADLMMTTSKSVEDSLIRLAQKARAAGIHLIVATQRPSVDVLTGIIKANFPARISYQVTSRVDSRTILDSIGAEKLLGKGDMLFLPPGTSQLRRIHGAMISDEEIEQILSFIKNQTTPTDGTDDDVFHDIAQDDDDNASKDDEFDEKYDEAVALVAKERQASISMIQRRLRVGYNRAARMIEVMEREGVVGPSDGIKPREVYANPLSFD